ncbi:MAG: response regulator [Victivallaceae bacterium]|nr:response regulator [Victivallaceae bacterium]
MKGLKYDIRRGADTYRAIWGSRLAKWITTGKIKTGEIVVWRSGLSGWRRAEELEELIPLFREQEKRLKETEIREHKPAPKVNGKKQIRKILLIDDEKDLCWLLTDVLNKKGYNVTSVNSRKTALTALVKENPDMVILDLKLPDGDGMNIIPKIKKNNADTVICVASAYGSIKKKEEAKQKGAFNFIDKPFTVTDILKNIVSVSNLQQGN